MVARPLSVEAQDWVVAQLNVGERALWQQLSVADQRHACEVARRVSDCLDHNGTDLPSDQRRDIVVAALLHDVGKLRATMGSFRLGTMGRTFVTILAALGIRRGVVETYRNHHEIGAEMLKNCGSSPLVVAWAREHELPSLVWTIDPEIATILHEADNG